MKGRVGSLLEVGTGFHQELTGRENVYLNGAILGMTRRDIDKRFDEIVAFSEVEKFIDTPVKHYSSGMTLRLAFAVAAHLEPEVLIVDEVLAVGDAQFQKKCIQKMEDVGGEGRTVLFVSHNMPAVSRMCQRVITLDGGRLVDDGPAHTVVHSYMSIGSGTMSERIWDEPASAPGGDVVILRAARIRTKEGNLTETVDINQPVGVDIEYDVIQSGHVLAPQMGLVSDEGEDLFLSLDVDPEWRMRSRPAGRYVSTAWIPGNLLTEGMCLVTVALWVSMPSRIFQFSEPQVLGFQVIDNMDASNSSRGDWLGDIPGVVRPLLEWETKYYENKILSSK
jgi:lipopolysaccharide transport system ATP-binding protein